MTDTVFNCRSDRTCGIYYAIKSMPLGSEFPTNKVTEAYLNLLPPGHKDLQQINEESVKNTVSKKLGDLTDGGYTTRLHKIYTGGYQWKRSRDFKFKDTRKNPFIPTKKKEQPTLDKYLGEIIRESKQQIHESERRLNLIREIKALIGQLG